MCSFIWGYIRGDLDLRNYDGVVCLAWGDWNCSIVLFLGGFFGWNFCCGVGLFLFLFIFVFVFGFIFGYLFSLPSLILLHFLLFLY
jgi:hypothetical protein